VIFSNPSISTYTRANMTIWVILAFQAGLLNIGGFMACHSFVSHVTGFATMFGVELGMRSYGHAAGGGLVPVCFLMGAMISGFLVDIRLRSGKDPKYHVVFGVLFSLILIVEIAGFNKLFGKFGEPLALPRDYALLGMLCLICGLQNATVSLVSKSVVRTTHLTGVTTDLGIGLVRMMNRRLLGVEFEGEGRANLMRIGIILGFVLGSVAGFQIFRSWEFRGFIFPTLISGGLFAATLYFRVANRGAEAAES
jgi:uncharacterized membrane protein YoaK (UPF0700 family)